MVKVLKAGLGAQDHVQLAGLHLIAQLQKGVVFKVELSLGIVQAHLLLKAQQRLREVPVLPDADPEGERLVLGQLPGGRFGLLKAPQRAAEAVPEHHARRSQADGVLTGAVKEGAAQFVLQLLDLAAHRGLGDIELVRRLGKAHAVSHLEKVLDL